MERVCFRVGFYSTQVFVTLLSMCRTGKACTRPGIYRSNDCGYEIVLTEGEQFPECPIHQRLVTWTFIKKAQIVKDNRKSR